MNEYAKYWYSQFPSIHTVQYGARKASLLPFTDKELLTMHLKTLLLQNGMTKCDFSQTWNTI